MTSTCSTPACHLDAAETAGGPATIPPRFPSALASTSTCIASTCIYIPIGKLSTLTERIEACKRNPYLVDPARGYSHMSHVGLTSV